MRPVLVCLFQGRFGNQMLQYLFARAWAERNGYELRHDYFVGEEVFELGEVKRPEKGEYLRFDEDSLCRLSGNIDVTHAHHIEFRGYALKQSCMLYTKKQAQEWLRIKPAWIQRFESEVDSMEVAFHHRLGDFIGYSYPVVSRQSFYEAADWYNFMLVRCACVCEETPHTFGGIPEHLSFLPDFLHLLNAKVLFRSNSTFSWLAGLLRNGPVFSPIVNGLRGGVEHNHVEFVAGNWPRLSDHDFVTDLHVPEI